RFGREIESRRRAPAADFHVFFRGSPNRNALMRDVGNCCQQLPQAVVVVLGSLFLPLDFLAQVLGFRDQGTGILAGLLQLGYVLGGTIAVRLQRLGFGFELAALGVDLTEIFEYLGWIHSPLPKLL